MGFLRKLLCCCSSSSSQTTHSISYHPDSDGTNARPAYDGQAPVSKLHPRPAPGITPIHSPQESTAPWRTSGVTVVTSPVTALSVPPTAITNTYSTVMVPRVPQRISQGPSDAYSAREYPSQQSYANASTAPPTHGFEPGNIYAAPYTGGAQYAHSNTQPASADTSSRVYDTSYQPATNRTFYTAEQETALAYSRLLVQVVTQARRAVMPRLEASTTVATHYGGSSTGLVHTKAEMWPEWFGSTQRMHNGMIAAAGELYVFELLYQLDLPGFGLDNWQSKLRYHARAHPDYLSIRNWQGTQSSDIIYRDERGDLTRELISGGYLPAQTWLYRRPTYHIEVKTTMRECEAKMFATVNQKLTMQHFSQGADGMGSPDNVYLLCRVYHLGEEGVAMRVFVDPHYLQSCWPPRLVLHDST